MKNNFILAVPITNRLQDLDEIYAELKKVNAKRVWLCTARGLEKDDVLNKEIEALKFNIDFFQSRGFEVGAWMSSFGHGYVKDAKYVDLLRNKYEYIRGVDGSFFYDSFCPACEPFKTDFSDWIATVASTGVKMIMLDDDYRLSWRGIGNGCFCEYHKNLFDSLVDEKVDRKDLSRLIASGKKSKYREAFLKINHDTLIDMAKLIREKVNKVNEHTRVGICAVHSTWGIDGADAIEISKALAGKTKPFVRTIGAPYWTNVINPKTEKLQYTLNFSLLQDHWLCKENIEHFGECDAYPRPRYNVPAAHLEMHDMILRASGNMDGILKYMIDYSTSAKYEKGYINAMAHHKKEYDFIEKYFNAQTVGVDIVRSPHLFENSVFPESCDFGYTNEVVFRSAKFIHLADSALPVCFGTNNVHSFIGETGKSVDINLLNDGCLIDLPAAINLMNRGIDVGIEQIFETKSVCGSEYFIGENEKVAIGTLEKAGIVKLSEKAVILSQMLNNSSLSCEQKELKAEIPVVFTYENENKQRFVIMNFDATLSAFSSNVFRSYSRQRQLIYALEWAGRKKLPAVCAGHPDLYMVCRKDKDILSVGLFNLSDDEIYDPEIILDGNYEIVDMLDSNAQVDGNLLKIDKTITPFSFYGVCLKTK